MHQQAKAREDPNTLTEMYARIESIIADVRNKNRSLLLLGGDFNAKIGKSLIKEPCVGRFSRGKRNASGQNLIDFCTTHQLFVCNSSFKHPARHITTWQNTRTVNGSYMTIYNQIDYIICPTSKKHCLIDARSFSNTLTDSDHRLVACKMEVDLHRLYKQKVSNKNKIYNCSMLVNDKEKQAEYQKEVETKINQLDNKKMEWKVVQAKICEAAESTIGYSKSQNNNNNRLEDREVEKLSIQQKELKLKINNCKDTEKMRTMKTERNRILHQIKKKLRKLKEKCLDEKIKEIDETKDSAKMFKAVNMLSRKKFENPYIHDKNGRHIVNPQHIYKAIRDHFQGQFKDETIQTVEPFERQPQKLDFPITKEEVMSSIRKLHNNRSAGYDNFSAELIKYGPENLHDILPTIINEAFEKHADIETGIGILVPLQKPGKVKGPVKNLRPVVLLPIIRKVLSNIVLERIRPKVEDFLSESQSAYRQYRSTSDIVWAYKWLIARTQVYQEQIYITGIDMSSAFDTIKREKLLEILSSFLENDELRIIRLLLSNTTLTIKLNNVKAEPFQSNIGSPQGDALSGTLFNIYLEYALRKIRSFFKNDTISSLPQETIYADDVDFITTEKEKQHNLSKYVKEILLEENLKVNESKTEETILERKIKVPYRCERTEGINLKITKLDNEEKWRTVKKLGSLLGDIEDVCRRKQLSIAALNKLQSIWIRKEKIKQALKIKLYKSLVKPVLVYNSGTWGLTRKEEEDLNAFHRQQLRRILNIKYPTIISNKQLYKQTGEEVLSLEILQSRWRLFGHVLRLSPETPAQKAMNYYFENSNSKNFRGRPTTTLPNSLHNDIIRLTNYTHNNKYNFTQLKSIDDIRNLRLLAQDRKRWSTLVKDIYEAAKAERDF